MGPNRIESKNFQLSCQSEMDRIEAFAIDLDLFCMLCNNIHKNQFQNGLATKIYQNFEALNVL
jgi:hypothetical protein